MRFLSTFRPRPFYILGLGVVLTLLLAVACGAAATATPAPKAAAPAAPSAEAKPAPVVAATPTPAPAAKPAPTAAPAAAAVNPGKLTWMTAGWGAGRFTSNFADTIGNQYGRILQGFTTVTNEKTELLPGIATKWELSPDPKTWIFTIRDGVKFHDGKELTAEDVWWTWMHYWGKDASGSALERATSGTSQQIARQVEKIELTAHNQVSFTLKSPDGGWSTRISEAGPNWFGILPGRPKVHDSAQEAAYDKNPIGTGPGKLIKHVPADRMAFERFDDYYYQPKNGLPEDRRLKFKSLDLRLIPEESIRVAAIRAGEADIAPASLSTRKQVEAGGGRLVFGPEGVVIHASLEGCYKSQYPCHDKRVRQALDLAIDKTVIRDKLYGGPEVFQVKGWHAITPGALGYSPDLEPWPQDVARARKLLADAGYPGGKGFGKLILHAYVSTALPFMPEGAQLAADFWRRELGLDVEAKVGDQTTLNRAALTGELHGQTRWRETTGRWDPSTAFDSSYSLPGHGSRLHDDPAIFQLAEQTVAVTDPTKRSEAYNKFTRVLREEHYTIAVGYANIPWAVGPRVAAWQPWPFSNYPSNLHGITLK